MRIRTGFSFHRAFGHVDDVLKRLADIEWNRQPISDTFSTFGFNRYTKAATAPAYGVELGVMLDPDEPMRGTMSKTPTWAFFAKDSLQPLHDLIAKAKSKKSTGAPLLNYPQALAMPGLIKIAGECTVLDYVFPDPPFGTVMDRMLLAEDFYLALSPATPRQQYAAAVAAGLPLIASSDNVYPRKEDADAYYMMLGKRSDARSYPQHILHDDEWWSVLDWVPAADRYQALHNRNLALAQCTATLQKAEMFVPGRSKPLRVLCQEGAARCRVNLRDPVYRERLNRELTLIAEKQFEDYFYIIADLVIWAKQSMLVGPARGSSCGSLVCYLLGITAVDPIVHDLLFERFLDVNRTDLPDIDLDFDDTERERAFAYVTEKYGPDHVARLGTVGFFRPKSALNQIGKIARIPQWEIDQLATAIVEHMPGDDRYLFQLEDTFVSEAGEKFLKKYPLARMAARFEGHPNAASQHAAGVCITKGPINQCVAIDRRGIRIEENIGTDASSTMGVAMCDMRDAEAFNMLKIDMLGLIQLSILSRAAELIGVPKPYNDFFEALSLNDPAVFEVFNEQRFSGIFQFGGSALQELSAKVTFTSIEDLIALTALVRPGPMNSAQTWIDRKSGRARVEYAHPLFEPYLNKTLGVVAYQEQVMAICRGIGGMSWEDVTLVRRAIGKSKGTEILTKFQDDFVAGAVERGVPAAVAAKVWLDLCEFGKYAFNRAHAAAYSIISYWCAWFKAYYPLEFGAASLDGEKDPLRQVQILRELDKEGIDYYPVDVDRSLDRWVPLDGERCLLGPLSAIKGLGPAKVSTILRTRGTGKQLAPGIKKLLTDPRTDIDTLYPVRDAMTLPGADGLDALTRAKVVSTLLETTAVRPGVGGPVTTAGVVARMYRIDENEPARVLRRGYAVDGPVTAINMFVQDDFGELFCKIGRHEYPQLGAPLFEGGRKITVGKTIVAVKGFVPDDFRMLRVEGLRIVTELDAPIVKEEEEEEEEEI